MIDRKMRSEALIGKKCRPVREIRNGAGETVSENTVCTIIRVGRGHGITIQTDRCPCCGQSCMIRGLGSDELTLISEEW